MKTKDFSVILACFALLALGLVFVSCPDPGGVGGSGGGNSSGTTYTVTLMPTAGAGLLLQPRV